MQSVAMAPSAGQNINDTKGLGLLFFQHIVMCFSFQWTETKKNCKYVFYDYIYVHLFTQSTQNLLEYLHVCLWRQMLYVYCITFQLWLVQTLVKN